MAPSAIDDTADHSGFPITESKSRLANGNGNGHSTTTSIIHGFEKSQFLFDRHLHKSFPVVSRADGNWLHLEDGRKIFDTTCGAAVSCLGHRNQRVLDAMYDQMQTGVVYLASTFFSSPIVEKFCRELIRGTKWEMSRVYLTGSGLSTQNIALEILTKVTRFGGNGGHNQVGPTVLP